PSLSFASERTKESGSVERIAQQASGEVAPTTPNPSGYTLDPHIVATTTIISNFDYAPTEDITTQTNANGTTVTNTYDSDQLYRLKQKSIDNGTQTLQQFLYDYDKVGNITHIVAESDTATLPNHIADYTYDSLYRLTGHTFTSSSSPSSYTESFTYDGIGNIVTSPQGSYFYQGTTTQNFANPHAATKVGAETLTYDKNGNLVNRTGNLTHTWDYNNRLVKIKLPSQQTGGFSAQSFGGPGQPTLYATYGYDTGGMRVYSHITNQATTTFAFPSFSKVYTATNATTTEHVSVNGVAVATIVTGTANPVVSWNFQDHLRSASIVTNSSANITEEVEYTAFGSLNNDIGTTIERKKYTGHDHDVDALSYTYAKARYLNTEWGRFLSQDPSYLSIGDSNFENQYGLSLEEVLSDPQSLNSYSYVKNNPINLYDPDGKIAIPFALPVFFVAPQAFLIGAAVVGVGVLIVGTAALLRNNNGLSQRPFQTNRIVRVPEQGQPFDTKPPKIPSDWPKWLKWVGGCAVACPQISELVEQYQNFKNWTENFKNKTESSQSNNNQNIMITEDYTKKLYTTPSGAVIDWWGNIISEPTN
ncbi:MAG: RHS repeat-associated core domain-containing protein, partial [Patescibacteria group bacterium]